MKHLQIPKSYKWQFLKVWKYFQNTLDTVWINNFGVQHGIKYVGCVHALHQ